MTAGEGSGAPGGMGACLGRSGPKGRNASNGDAVYALGMIGAMVYFFRAAGSRSDYAPAFLKAMVWPALLVYEAFKRLDG